MRMDSDSEIEDALVDAALRDETWQTASTAYKVEALKAFRTRHRLRKVTRWAGSVAALLAVLVGVVLWVGRRAPAPRQVMVALTRAPQPSDKPRQLTDQDLVAAFPKGSCFIAEIDGRKELVFLNPEVERTYVARRSLRDN